MRIALLSWESLHSIAVGGVAAHVSELAAAVARKGHQVHVFTRGGVDQRCHDWIDGVHYHRCTYRPDGDFVDDVNNMCRSIVDRVFEVEDLAGRFDIIHAHDWLAANAMIWIKQGRGHTCLLTIHSTEYARCGNAFADGQAERIRYQERAGTYWADRVIAVSHATGDEIAWMYEVPTSKTVVIYNGVTPQRFDRPTNVGADKRQYDLGPMDPTILFCGRLVWQKGPDLLVQAAPQILRQHPSAKFVFVGDGDMRGSLQSRARELDIGHAVRFLGYRNGDELVHLFKIADAVCLPSRNEPFGIVVLEAWSAGKPVIASQNGGMGEYVQHEVNGLKIYPSPDSVAWGVSRTFSDFDRARWMGRNGRRAVEERFTWDMIADQTLAVYEELCPRPVSRPQQVDGRITPTTRVEVSDDTSEDGTFEESPAEPPSRETIGALLQVEAKPHFGTGDLAHSTDDALTASRLSLVRSGLQPRQQGRALVVKGDGETVFPGKHSLSPYGCHESTDANGPDGQPQTPCRRQGSRSRHHHSHGHAQVSGPQSELQKEMIVS
jgi:glycosyltransferase involved in cell wall biosynthesis